MGGRILCLLPSPRLCPQLGAALGPAAAGWEVVACEDAAALDREWSRHGADVLLIDAAQLALPGDPRLERARACVPEVLVVAVAPTFDEAWCAQAAEVGVADFVTPTTCWRMRIVLARVRRDRELRAAFAGAVARVQESKQLNHDRVATLLQLSQMRTASLRELTDFALEAAVRLTGSRLGYLALMNEDESVLTMLSWSRTAMAECAVPNPSFVYPVEQTGLWGEAVRLRKAVITNDYLGDVPGKKGCPPGHVPISRHLNVPIFEQDRIVALVGVGNKETLYDEEDVKQLTLLMTGMWQILEHHRSLLTCRESEDRFRHLADHVPVMISMTNERGELVYLNQAWLKWRGKGLAEELAGGVEGAVHEADLPAFRQSWQASLAGRRPFMLEYRITNARGEPRFVSHTAVPRFDEDGRYGGHVAVINDVSEQRQIEEALRQSRERFRALVDSSQDLITVHDANATILYESPSAGRILGYPPGGLVGKAAFDLVHDEDLYLAREAFAKVTQRSSDAAVAPSQLRVRHADGSWVSLECIASNQLGNPAVGGILLNSRDVSERERSRQTREQLEKQLRQAQKMEAIGTLAGGIAHDFNNILGAVFGYSDLARQEVAAGSAVREYLDEIAKAGERARDLVRQILAFSRQQEQEFQPVEAQTLLKEALKLLRASIPSTIEIQTDFRAEGAKVLADPSQLHQIVINLASNAAHAMRESGGVLGIGLAVTEVTEPQLAQCGELLPGTYVVLKVSDTGVGMEKAVLERIFDPFYTTKPPSEGTGLGLSVVHGAVRRHKGAIRVTSQPRCGAEFNIYFPAYRQPAPAPGLLPTAVPHGHGERVLLVDDEATLVAVGKRMLERLGYRVTTQVSSEMALDMVISQPQLFDLVVTDQTMPGVTGCALAEHVCRIRPDLPVIVLTGYSTRFEQEGGLPTGVWDVLMKPFTSDQLGAMAHRMIVLAKASAARVNA